MLDAEPVDAGQPNVKLVWNRLAVASFVSVLATLITLDLAFLAVAPSAVSSPVLAVLTVVSTVLAFRALRQLRATGGRGRGLALTGAVAGVIGCVVLAGFAAVFAVNVLIWFVLGGASQLR